MDHFFLGPMASFWLYDRMDKTISRLEQYIHELDARQDFPETLDLDSIFLSSSGRGAEDVSRLLAKEKASALKRGTPFKTLTLTELADGTRRIGFKTTKAGVASPVVTEVTAGRASHNQNNSTGLGNQDEVSIVKCTRTTLADV